MQASQANLEYTPFHVFAVYRTVRDPGLGADGGGGDVARQQYVGVDGRTGAGAGGVILISSVRTGRKRAVSF